MRCIAIWEYEISQIMTRASLSVSFTVLLCNILDQNHHRQHLGNRVWLYVLVPEGNEIFDSLTGWPTTFFVDGEGRILREPIVGANTKGYESAVEELLLQ